MARHQQQPNQLRLNFEQTVMPAEPVPMAPLSFECLGIIHAHMPSPDLSDILSRNAPLPQAWNFRDEFPSPLPQALAEGVFGEDELTAQDIEAIHVERANELLGLLDEITACEKAKLHGVAQTGKAPRTAATRRRLMERLQQAPGLLRAQFDDLMQAYADGFGEPAAEQFSSWVKSIHRDQLPRPEVTSHEIDLPVPTPLAEAVNKGVFGTDDNGDPIEPSEEEVHEISLQHGEQLAEVYQELDSVKERLAAKPNNREELIRHKERLTCQAQGMLAFYAEDFGETAARHLESWARHQIFD